ncbi:hypothetical protein BT93_F2641 [Corymbia citriodora subsp. variegata]|nr:hypothetical protein BT93_F2641 [Corymbia citriodora subsp. variegata]KAF8025871.1 hypothetical protein BT93_F2641 [Corymbia citriodora subsp. variegata]
MTKKRRVHRAFGLAICRVMGWDVERLPLIVAKGEPLSRSLVDPSLSQKVYEEGAATKSDENYDEEISIPGIDGEGKADGPTAAKEDDSMGIKNLNRRNIDARADEEILPQCSDFVLLPTSSVEWPCGNLVDSSATAASGWRTLKSLSSRSVLAEVKGYMRRGIRRFSKLVVLFSNADLVQKVMVIRRLMMKTMEKKMMRMRMMMKMISWMEISMGNVKSLSSL